MVSISACHAEDPGSAPGRGVVVCTNQRWAKWRFCRIHALAGRPGNWPCTTGFRAETQEMSQTQHRLWGMCFSRGYGATAARLTLDQLLTISHSGFFGAISLLNFRVSLRKGKKSTGESSKGSSADGALKLQIFVPGPGPRVLNPVNDFALFWVFFGVLLQGHSPLSLLVSQKALQRCNVCFCCSDFWVEFWKVNFGRWISWGWIFGGLFCWKKQDEKIRPKNLGPNFGRPKFVSQNSAPKKRFRRCEILCAEICPWLLEFNGNSGLGSDSISWPFLSQTVTLSMHLREQGQDLRAPKIAIVANR